MCGDGLAGSPEVIQASHGEGRGQGACAVLYPAVFLPVLTNALY